MTSLARVPTRRLIFTAVILSAAAWVCHVLDKATWQHARTVSHVFDSAGFILFWASYILLWALLIIAPFRPQASFSMHGECGKRASNFSLALGGLLIVHLGVALTVVLYF